ncbi:MAG TPA: DUF4340 domain-containing protein [Lacipirellulaceae bacterium]|nr:DUF4340 domain-containing protein [Lacipirellulaceae bacterium]
MSENAKTITFVAVGMLAVVVGLVTQPKSAEVDDNALLGQNLTDEFASPDEAKRLRIVRFNEATADLSNFEVAEKDGLWSIPSKNDYPADAAQQMAEAATSLMDRKILGVATKSAGDHEEYGVIDPLSPKLEAGQKGVGTRVTLSDLNNKPVVDLIIGKAVKDADQQRFVREADRDIVYIIEIDPGKLSTNFEDWIEKDLLKLNSWDLQQVAIKDYSAELVQGLTQDGKIATGIDWDRRAEMTFAYNDTDAKWSAEKLQQFNVQSGDEGQYVDFTLAEDEELNEQALNDLKTALDDLQIVDVARKPAGLSQDLKAGTDFLNNNETLLDLMTKGFTALSGAGGGPAEIISSDGEVIATMKDGTEYVLRFGDLTSRGDAAQEDEATAEAGETDEKPADGSEVNRYLFVMARFNESAVKQPQLEQLPELPAGTSEPIEEKAPESNSGEAPAGDSAGTESAEGETAPAAGETTESTEQDEQDDEEANSPPSPFVDPAQDESASAEGAGDESVSSDADAQEPAANEDEPAQTGENGSQQQPNTETPAATSTEPPDGGESADAAPPAAQEGQESESTTQTADEKAKSLETIIADRKRIEQENQRKLDEYQETLKKGRENVKELNLRFGDWYFVVSDDVFKKIRLGRKDVVKKKEKKGEADAAQSGDTASNGEDTASGSTDDPSPIPGLPPIPNSGEETETE